MHFIYRLIDPRCQVTGYIGITNHPNGRYKQHMAGKDGNQRKLTWIEQVRKAGVEPEMEIIEIVKTRKKAEERERYWIQHYQELGAPLTNIQYVNHVSTTQPLRLHINMQNMNDRIAHLYTTMFEQQKKEVEEMDVEQIIQFCMQSEYINFEFSKRTAMEA